MLVFLGGKDAWGRRSKQKKHRTKNLCQTKLSIQQTLKVLNTNFIIFNN